MEQRRVVVTGMGVICPTGNDVITAWRNAAQGISGIGLLTRVDRNTVEIAAAGEVKGFDPDEALGRREARRTDRVSQFALVAAQQALADSGLVVDESNHYDVGCVIGTGVGGMETLVNTVRVFDARGHKAVSPLAVPMMLPDAASGKVSMAFGLRGPNFNITTACATGNNCIGEAAHIIRRGDAIAMLAGSTESAFVGPSVASFNNMTAITRNPDPTTASRPFDLHRDGFVMGEGAGVLLLEDMEHALARGATIYAEVLGYGHTSDAYHVTAPLETGEGATTAIQRALRSANLQPEAVNYVNAHGTSTALNDKSETLALKKALGEHAYTIPVSSTKSVTGHLMGAAAAVEAVFSIMALRENFVPPTINLQTPDPDCDLDYVPHNGRRHAINVVMSNSFGFGGHNAVLLFGKVGSNGHHA